MTRHMHVVLVASATFVAVAGCGEIPSPPPSTPRPTKAAKATGSQVPPPAPTPSATASAPAASEGGDQEQRDWAELNGRAFGFCGGDLSFKDFLQKYPWTRFKDEADKRIAELEKECSDHLAAIPEGRDAPEPSSAQMRATVRSLFAKCAANKSKLVVLNQRRLAAAKAGDEAGARDAFKKLGELEPVVTKTIDQLNEAILDLTGGRDPEMSKLAARVKRECL